MFKNQLKCLDLFKYYGVLKFTLFLRTNNTLLEKMIETYKRKFDRDLKHIKIILTSERRRLPYSQWLDLVHETREIILRSPEDFFCYELPSKTILSAAIAKIFVSFLKDQRIREVQSSIHFKIFPRGSTEK